MFEASLVELPLYECHWASLMISQHWLRQWLGAVRQQAITWANVDPDLCRHMASLGHNELIENGRPCIVEIIGTQGHVLFGDPASEGTTLSGRGHSPVMMGFDQRVLIVPFTRESENCHDTNFFSTDGSAGCYTERQPAVPPVATKSAIMPDFGFQWCCQRCLFLQIYFSSSS